MTVRELLEGIRFECVRADLLSPDSEISEVCYDNRKCVPGCVFIAIVGTKFDAHDAVAEAVSRGAVLVVIEHDIAALPDSADIIKVSDTRNALALISANWFGNPSRQLTTIGLTGTKGKSTTAYMVRNILEKCGHKCGIIGTIGVGIGDRIYKTSNTTPESYIVQQYLRQMVDEGCDSLVMEVSSQALKQNRVAGIMFNYAVFTNLESDHIGENEHADFAEYMYCKSLLFRQCEWALGNSDDPHFDDVVCCKAPAPEGWEDATGYMYPVEAFGCNDKCDVSARNIRLLTDSGNIGIAYDLVADERDMGEVKLSIPGRFNVYNSLAALSVCRRILSEDADGDFEIYRKKMASAYEALFDTQVIGRLEPCRISDRFSLIIDYAHNAMALESLLKTLKEYNPKRLVCMFGCGGNRSKERRYEMGEISAKLADLTVVTSDNPRYEKPMDIINDILIGVSKASGDHITIVDRREAIKYVIENAQDGDVIVLAGKGQEDYQEIEGVKYPMDERVIVAETAEEIRSSRGYV